MKRLFYFGMLAGLGLAANALASPINVGDILYADNGLGSTQFYLDNYTGPDLCLAPDAPVCTALTLTGTLSYSYLDDQSHTVFGSALISSIGPDSDNGGSSYTPDGFTIPSLTILTASFTGTFTPVNFSVDTGGGGRGAFQSTGVVVSTAFDDTHYAFLVTSEAETTGPVAPEPATTLLVAGGLLVLAAGRSRRFRRT